MAGFHRTIFSSARDPDFEPPSSRAHIIGIWLYDFSRIFRRSDFWFGVKVAILIGLSPYLNPGAKLTTSISPCLSACVLQDDGVLFLQAARCLGVSARIRPPWR